MTTYTRPIQFNGSAQEKKANFQTHDWQTMDDETVCWSCDSKPWHAAAYYPCGQEPPRERVSA